MPADDRAAPGPSPSLPTGPPSGLSSLPTAPALTDVQPHIGGTNKLAVTALVFVPLTFGCLGIPFALAFGHVALAQIRRYGQEGKGLAITGLVAGYLSLTVWILALVFA